MWRGAQSGMNALHCASRDGVVDVVRVLLDHRPRLVALRDKVTDYTRDVPRV